LARAATATYSPAFYRSTRALEGVVREEITNLFKGRFWSDRKPFIDARIAVEQSASLPHDWNTYDAAPPNEVARQNALVAVEILERSKLPPMTGPTAEGGIAMTFFSDTARQAILEIYNDGEMAVGLYDNARDPTVWSGDFSNDAIQRAAERIRLYFSHGTP
jgi:hypothetical protein